MSDFREQVQLAALQALREGGENSDRVIEAFGKHLPVDLRLPLSPGEEENDRIRALIQLMAQKLVVINGEETTGFPSTFAISRSTLRRDVGCTGVLISPDVAVTAAHCLASGFNQRVFSDSEKGETTIQVARSRTHEKFGEPDKFRNDIGLLLLKAPPATLPIYRIGNNEDIDAAGSFRLVGYGNDENGNTQTKRTAPVHHNTKPPAGTIWFQDSELVIGDPLVKTDGDAWERDSGGPVLLEVGTGQYELAAIVSRPVDLQHPRMGDGTICVRLDKFTDWIDENIDRLGGQPRPK